MKKIYRHASLILTLLTLILAACSFSTANIQDATMAQDAEGNQPTTVFAPDDTFYGVVQLANAPDDTTVRGVWTAVDVEGVEPDFRIDEAEITQGSGTVYLSLTPPETLWPPGSYKLDIYLNDELDRTLEFEVR